jgi:hypothetical protein
VAEWPEPEADPEERQRWWGRLALAGAVAAAAILLMNSGDDRGQWQLPDFELPTFDMPEISALDLRGRETSNAAPGPGTATDSMAMILNGPPADGSPFVQASSFADCRRTIDGTSQAFGPPAVLQDTSTRYVARFKLTEGIVTITCADGAMTIEQGG